MGKLSCEICGSNDLIKENGAFVCQNCGIKYTLEEVRAMLNGGESVPQSTGTVTQINNTDVQREHAKVENLYTLAKSSYDSKNFEQAENYCNQMVLEDRKRTVDKII